MDILATHRHEVPHRKVWDLGGDLAAYPRPTRKARRGPEKGTRPFDAAEFVARDKDKPTDTKHTASLIKELDELLSMAPQIADDNEERSYLIKASIDELDLRGFDRKDLMQIVVNQVSRTMVFWACIVEVISKGGLGAAVKLDFEVPSRWYQIGHSLVEVRTEDSGTSISLDFHNIKGIFTALVEWNSRQDFDSLISWEKLPSADSINHHSARSKNAAIARADWIVDRFARTYPDDWRTWSLDLEWKYIHGQEVGCCRPEQMRLRPIRHEDIAVVLAERAVKRRDDTKGRERIIPGTKHFTEASIGLLLAGRYDSAAAIYEALHRIDPTDPELANNLGFCLMPTDPERALALFVESISLSSHPQPVAWANQVAALYVLGRDAEACALAEQGHQHANTSSAWLWTINDSRIVGELGAVSSVAEYVDNLKARIATAEGTSTE
jgi:tetratricopeptide (TPR) repeat protein